MKTPIDYAEFACDTLMNKYTPLTLVPVNRFHYHQGVFLSGMERTYELCGLYKYSEYIKAWVDSHINEDGTVLGQSITELDDMMPGILLFRIYNETKEEKYNIAIEHIYSVIMQWRRNEYGGFWHKYSTPDQMWLDGLYMAGSFLRLYAHEKNDICAYREFVKQAKLMYENIRCERSGLLRHGWDASKKAGWADNKTGKSPECWGRAMGWYVTAVVDMLDFLPDEDNMRCEILEILRSLLVLLEKFQSKQSGMWYQILDKPGEKGNFEELSCTALITYAMAKAVRQGYIPKEYAASAKKGYEGVIAAIGEDENGIILPRVCIGTGIADYDYYINRPLSVNDLHGAGAFILMCTEMAK